MKRQKVILTKFSILLIAHKTLFTTGLIQHDGQQPTTSQFPGRGGGDDEEPSITDEKSKLIKDKSLEEEDEKETEAQRRKKILMEKLMMIPNVVSSVLVSLTLKLHRISRSYRYVMRVLAEEKDALKVRLV